MSLPFFDVWQACFPDSPVDIIAKESVQEIFFHHPAIRRIHPFSKARIRGWRGLLGYGKSLQREFGPYDLFLTLPCSISSALIGQGVGSRFRVGFAEAPRWLLTHRLRRRTDIHRAYAYAYLLYDFLESMRHEQNFPAPVILPAIESLKKITLHFSAEERRAAFFDRREQQQYVVFNVNSEAQSRRLESAKWVELGQRLLSYNSSNIRLVFVGAPNERQRVGDVIQAIDRPERLLDYSGKTTVRDLARLLRDADAVATNDSGPMHLANAVGAAMVTWIGAADPIETEPFNAGNVRVINTHLSCSPCVKNRCKFPTVRCLEQISVNEIYHHVLDVLHVAGRES